MVLGKCLIGSIVLLSYPRGTSSFVLGPARPIHLLACGHVQRVQKVSLGTGQEPKNSPAFCSAERRSTRRPRPPGTPGLRLILASDTGLGATSVNRANIPNAGESSSGAFCDQCGDLCATSALAVCEAPNCGVSFAQCTRCGAEYSGCCSTACQTLTAEFRSGLGQDPAQHTLTRSSPQGPGKVSFSGIPNVESEMVDVKAARLEDGAAISVGDRVTKKLKIKIREEGSTADSLNGLTVAGTVVASKPQKDTINSGEKENYGGKERASSLPASSGSSGNSTKREEPEHVLESYASRHSASESPCLTEVRESTNRAQPGGAHMVSGHLQGEMLKLLTRLNGAKRVLDIGTFTGYSALAFAEALPEDGVVITLESDSKAAETATKHFDCSENGGKIRLLLGQAMNSIDQLMEEESPQFDVIFIDADKKRYWDYYNKVLDGPRPLLAPTGILLADNVLFHELVPLAEAMAADNSQGNFPASAGGDVPQGAGVLAPTPRRLKIAESLDGFNKRVRDDDRVEVLMLPLRDGLTVVRWRDGRYPNGS